MWQRSLGGRHGALLLSSGNRSEAGAGHCPLPSSGPGENTVAKRVIQLGHSPDADDAFMFYALTQGKLDTAELQFQHVLEEIERLNRRAMRGELEVSAISVHAYAYVADRYALCEYGCSMGERYGPIIVARERMRPEQLHSRTIAVPGTMITAFLTLKLLLRVDFAYEIMPFDEILGAVSSGQVDAGLVIHEGQLSYVDAGLEKVIDLGQWWYEQAGLPLPLGANAIRKDLGSELMSRVAGCIRASIEYAIEHEDEALCYAQQYARGLALERTRQFVRMYVNEWTKGYGERGRQAVDELLRRAHAAGMVPRAVRPEFIA